MPNKSRHLSHCAIFCALYVVLTHFQNLLLPGSATWAVQLRLSEVLCVLAFFTPAAIPGLTAGCFLFNLIFAGALPLDMLLGSLATFLATLGMWHSRRLRFRGLPLPGLLLPALWNGLLVGWELTVYTGGAFLLNAGSVALGEAAVLLLPGAVLCRTIQKRDLARRLFG